MLDFSLALRIMHHTVREQEAPTKQTKKKD